MLRVEFWKTIKIKGEKVPYKISSEGRVMSKITNKILKTTINEYGYEIVGLRTKPKKRVTKSIHRLVAKAFVENPDPDNYKEINHKDGNKLNNYMDNLEWTDRSGNMSHAFKTGLKISMKGEDHPMHKHKHTDEKIHEVCKLMEQGYSNKEIHKITNVDKNTISEIRTGAGWKHISKDYNIRPESFLGKLHNRKNTEEEIHEVCKLMEQGYGNKEISKKLGISIHVVNDVRSHKGWNEISKNYNIHPDSFLGKYSQRVYTEDQIREVCKYLEKGYRSRDVAEVTGISIHVVNDIRGGKTWTHISKDYNIKKSHTKVDASKYWDMVDKALLDGMSRKEIRDTYPTELTRTQYDTLISNRMHILQNKGLM